ncbi:MAG: hypothetical protein OXU77_20235 [Gammaproteobacteria bacterium]|nr:hypothetical protein [Gammaproteobacteria bacterium]
MTEWMQDCWMEASITDTVRDCAWIVGLIDARAPKPTKPGTK